MSKNSNMKIFFVIAAFLLSADTALAQDYRPLAPIPQLVERSGNASVGSFLGELVPLIIGIAGALAVIRIIIGGVQYMTTDSWGGKGSAKETIKGAVVGLILAMSAYTILYTINPKLVDINIVPEKLNRGGGPLNADGLNETEKDAEELGCANCEEIPRSEMSVSLRACEQNTCYAQDRVIDALEKLLNTKNESDRVVNWQVTRAFPSSQSEFTCFKPNVQTNITEGFCVEVALPNPTEQNLKAFLQKAQGLGLGFFNSYIVPTEARRTTIRNIAGLSNEIKNKITVVPSSTEHARIGEFKK